MLVVFYQNVKLKMSFSKTLSNIFDSFLHEKFLIIMNPPYIGHTSCKTWVPNLQRCVIYRSLIVKPKSWINNIYIVDEIVIATQINENRLWNLKFVEMSIMIWDKLEKAKSKIIINMIIKQLNILNYIKLNYIQ